MVKRRKHAECESLQWHTIRANEEIQREILTHLLAGKVELDSFTYADDGIYFITIFTSTNKQFGWQVRPRTYFDFKSEKVGSCFGEFFPMDGHTRYDLYDIIPELQQRMDEIAFPVLKSYIDKQNVGNAYELLKNQEEKRVAEVMVNSPILPDKEEKVVNKIRRDRELFTYKYFCFLFLFSLIILFLFFALNLDKLS